MLLQAILFGLMFFGVYRYIRIRYLIYRSSANVPNLPGGIPLLGHITILWDLSKFIKDSARETEALGGVTKLWVGAQPFFNITDPEMAQKVMNECLQKTPLLDATEPWVGKGIFSAKLPQWKHTRKQLNPTFNQHVLDSFLVVFNAQARRLVDVFRQKAGTGEFNPHPILSRNLMESVCHTIMGLSENETSLVDDKYISSAQRMFQIVVQHVKSLYPDFIYNLTNLKKEEDRTIQYIKDVSRKLLALRKASVESHSNKDTNTSGKFKTFLELLLEMKDLSDEQILNEVNTMITAGFHTLQSTITVYLVYLGSYPEVQAKVYEELREVFCDSDRDVTKEDLRKLVYLEATLKESLRLWPVALTSGREALEDVKFDNWTIPKGTEIYVSYWGLQRSKRIWGPDADEFRPERWLNPATVPEHPAAFAVFGFGRRNCIGKSYALMNMKTIMVHVFRHFIVKGNYSKLKFDYSLILTPSSGDSISVEHRLK